MHQIGPSPGSPLVPTRLRVLAVAPLLCPHVEFAVAEILGTPVSIRWTDQPALPGQQQAGLDYAAASGSAGVLASRLRRLGSIRFEITEAGASGCDPQRYAYDPDLGLHQATLAANGDVVVTEQQIRQVLSGDRAPAALEHTLRRLVGEPWDDALDRLRSGGEGAPVTWLRRTG